MCKKERKTRGKKLHETPDRQLQKKVGKSGTSFAVDDRTVITREQLASIYDPQTPEEHRLEAIIRRARESDSDYMSDEAMAAIEALQNIQATRITDELRKPHEAFEAEHMKSAETAQNKVFISISLEVYAGSLRDPISCREDMEEDILANISEIEPCGLNSKVFESIVASLQKIEEFSPNESIRKAAREKLNLFLASKLDTNGST